MLEWVQVKDCKRFTKRCYTLRKKIDNHFLNEVNDLGETEIFPFSKFSPVSHDAFRIRFIDLFEIAGTMNDVKLFVTVGKGNEELWVEIEKRITAWAF
jgi:hypothetical protein